MLTGDPKSVTFFVHRKIMMYLETGMLLHVRKWMKQVFDCP